jgi:glycolate oxidase FAD binding subunit
MADFALAGLNPHAVTTPATADELAQTLRDAAACGLGVVPWGGGTRQHIGRPPARYDLALMTGRLDQIVAFHPADLVVTVEAGITLGAVQAELARHGQWLPWDPPLSNQASIGGLLASSAAGPLRLGFGPPRDWTLGMRVALGDGRLVTSGGRVVKNVAGYDSHRLQIGAYGTLGVIVEATFKLQPLPERRRTLVVAITDACLPEQAFAALRDTPLEPITLIALNRAAAESLSALHSFLSDQPRQNTVAAQYAGTTAAVTRQLREATRRCVELGARTVELHEAEGTTLWDAIANFTAPAGDGSLLLRAALPSGAITPVAKLAERVAEQCGWPAAQLAIGGPGIVYSRWVLADAEPGVVADAIAEFRASLANVKGYTVIEQAPPMLGLDIWGADPEGAALMRSLRGSWDPAGILNPGRYVID